MRLARLIFFFLSFQFFLYNMGLTGRRLSLLASAVSLLIFIALSLPRRELLDKRVHIVPAIILALTLIVVTRGVFEEVFVFPLLCASLLLLPARRDHGDGERESLVIAGFIFSTLVILQFHMPLVWHLLHDWGLSFSRAAGRLIGQKYLLGETATGIPLLIMFLSYHVAVAILARDGGSRYLVKTAVLLLVLQAAVLVLLTPLAILIQSTDPDWDLFLFHPEILLFAGMLLTLLFKPPPLSVPERGFSRGPSLVLVAVTVLCSILLMLRPATGSSGGNILLYDQGYMNWRVPVYGYYGHKSGGMFGFLPRYLEASGYNVKTVSELTVENLSDAHAVVVINVLEFFSDEERGAIEQFVQRGGGLLALGDHTGVKGIRGPFNDLLEPFGIEYLFDSATFISKGWGEEAVLMPHTITHGLYSPQEMDIWVGASLRAIYPAYPVVVAKYGYSDFGDFTAVDHAFLGNRVFDPGEQLGDMVLVAAREYGKGRVLVFGDTSSFQNGALTGSYRFVTRTFSWLVSGGNRGAVRLLYMPIVIAVIVFAAVVRKKMFMIGAVSAAVLLGTFIGLAPRKIAGEVKLGMPTAVIDRSHLERFDELTWYDDCTGGLLYNIMRAGCFPLVTAKFSDRQVLDSELLVVIAPVKPFNKHESEILDGFMENGGWILYSCGTEERDGSWRYLARHGLGLQYVPLTSFADSLWGFQIQVNEGWSVEITNPQARVIADEYGFPYIVEVKHGEGGMVLIADSNFLLNKNLEGMEGYFAGNIDFLKVLFHGMRGVNVPDSVKQTKASGVGL